MKPEDEILLTDYLEGDLEASKVEYVEKLLKEDTEAQKLMNQLKKAEIEIEDLKNKAPEKISKIAIEISTDVIRQLTSIEVNNSSISAIVNDLSKDKDKYYGV